MANIDDLPSPALRAIITYQAVEEDFVLFCSGHRFSFFPAKSFLGAALVFPCLPKDSNLITRRAVVAQSEEDWDEKQKVQATDRIWW